VQKSISRKCAGVGYTLRKLRVMPALTASHGCFRPDHNAVRNQLRGGADDTRTAAGAVSVSRYFCTMNPPME
jgi:hypothetical protein